MIRRRIAEIIGTELIHHAPAGIDQIAPVLEWIAEPSGKYREKYAEIARRPTHAELHASWQRARELGLKFETTTFERH